MAGGECGEEGRRSSLFAEHESCDTQQARVQAGPCSQPARAGAVGAVGDLDHVRAAMLHTVGSGEPKVERLRSGPEHLREGRERRVHLGVPVRRRAHDRRIQAERHVVHEHAAVDVGEGHRPFHGRPVGVERPDHVVAVQPQIQRQVVPRPGGDHDHRETQFGGDGADHRLGAVTSCHAEDVGSTRRHVAHALEPVLTGAEHDRLDPASVAFARPGRSARPSRPPTSGS